VNRLNRTSNRLEMKRYRVTLFELAPEDCRDSVSVFNVGTVIGFVLEGTFGAWAAECGVGGIDQQTKDSSYVRVAVVILILEHTATRPKTQQGGGDRKKKIL
jgi:hypothetical protein